MKQGALYRMESLILSIHPYDYYYIISAYKFFFIKTITFSYQSCQMMPYNTVSHFLADGYSQSVAIQLVFQHIHN